MLPRAVLRSVLLALLALPSSLTAQDPPDKRIEVPSPAEALEAGRAALAAGDLPQALSCFELALELGESAAWNGIAAVRRQDGDPSGAADALAARLEADPFDDAARRELVELLVQLPGREWEALPLAADLVRDHPDELALLVHLAGLQSVLGWHAEARSGFRSAARRAQEAGDEALAREALLGLADDFNRAGERHRAEALYRQLLDEGSTRALRGLADLELRQGRPLYALDLYARALGHDPDDFSARENTKLAEAAARPRLFAFGQSYADNADFDRSKVLAGVDFGLGHGLRLRAAYENARFEDGAGRELTRDSGLLGATLRPDPFVAVHLDLQAGDQGAGSPLRGGVGVDYEPTDAARFRAGYRHDHFVDPVDPYGFDSRNDVLDLRMADLDGLQSETFYANASFTPADALGFAGYLEGGTIQDRNNRSKSGLQLHWAGTLAPGWTLTPRAFYRHRHYQLPSNRYFAATNLEAWGAGLHLSTRSYDGARRFSFDAAAFRMPGGIDDWGARFEAALAFALGDASDLVLESSWLSTPERAPAPQLRSLAVMAGFALAF
jgi:hypothetical protein